MHRWVQIKETDILFYKNKHSILPEAGHYYTDQETGERMVEFHLNCCQAFQELVRDREYGEI